jgi:hypothetical protein
VFNAAEQAISVVPFLIIRARRVPMPDRAEGSGTEPV